MKIKQPYRKAIYIAGYLALSIIFWQLGIKDLAATMLMIPVLVLSVLGFINATIWAFKED